MSDDPKEVAKNFFCSYLCLLRPLSRFLTINQLSCTASYLGFPIVLLFWIVGYIWKRTLPKPIDEIDLDVRLYLHHDMFEHLLTYVDALDWSQELAHC